MDSNIAPIPDAISTHLLSSLPSERLPNRFKIKFKKLRSNWDAFDSESLPAINLYPSSFYSLANQSLNHPWNLKIMAIACDLKRQQYMDSDPYYIEGLGYTWRGTWKAKLLGKRATSASENSKSRLIHQLTFSRLGIERRIPQSRALDGVMKKIRREMPNFQKATKNKDFELRFDEMTRILELRILKQTSLQPIKLYELYKNKVFKQPSNDPSEMVPELVESALRSPRFSKDTKLFTFYSQIYSCFEIWIATHEDCSTTTLLPDLDHRLRPIEYIIRWSEAFFRFFFCPLVKVSCPTALLGVPLREVFGVPNGRSKAEFFVKIENALEYFDDVEKLAQMIEVAKHTGKIDEVFEACLEVQSVFRISILQDQQELAELVNTLMASNSHFVALNELLQKEINSSKRQRLLPRLKRSIAKLELTAAEMYNLKCLDYCFFTILRKKQNSNDLLVRTKTKWFEVRDLNGQRYLSGCHEPEMFNRVGQVNSVATYKQTMICFLETDKMIEVPEICVFHRHNLVKMYAYPDDWLMQEPNVSRYFTNPPVWSQGTCLKLGRRTKSELYIFLVDIRPCALDQALPPKYSHKYIEGFELDPRDATVKKGNLWAYVCGSIGLLSYEALCLPMLWYIKTANNQISHPKQIDWSIFLPVEAIQKFLSFEPNHSIRARFHLTVTEQPARMFLCVLDTASGLSFWRETRFELTILVFGLKSCLSTPSFQSYSKFLLQNLVCSYDPEKQMKSSAISVKNKDFLLIWLGETHTILVGMVGYRLQWFPVNNQRYFSIPRTGGQQLMNFGLHSNYFSQFYYSTESAMFAKDLKLRFQYLDFSF